MRVAWLIYGALDQRTGGTLYDAIVIEGLRDGGDDVQVMSLPPPRGRLRASREVATGAALARKIIELGPDVVVGDELCFREIAIAFPLLRRRRIKRVLLVHHLTAWETERSARERRIARAVERAAMRGSDRVIATSEATRRRLVVEGCGVGVEVVVPGSDRLAGARARSGTGTGTGTGTGVRSGVRVVFVGTIGVRKRVVELVRAFGRGADERATLTLVGSTTREVGYAREVAAVVEALGIGERVKMVGEIEDAEVARELARADVLVLPSSFEGYGIAATEAIHFGVPVIVGRTPALEEALAPCPAAALYVDSEHDLATALHRFTTDEALRGSMRRAARDASACMPSWSACIRCFRSSLADLYAGVHDAQGAHFAPDSNLIS